MMNCNEIKTVLSIAGSDSCGGAGIQADLKTCCAFRVYGMTAITAVTAQNTLGVQAIEVIKPEMIREQINSVVNDCRPDALKIGMVGNADAVRVIANTIKVHGLRNIVVDPVLVASSGSSLSGELSETIEAFFAELFPLADIITPNIPEAISLLGIEEDFEDPREMSVRLLATSGSKAVLVKGGHGVKEECRDYLLMHTSEGIEAEEFSAPRIRTPNTHGTGCTLSSAIACGLAKGMDLKAAVEKAKHYISRALESGKVLRLGHGTGPLDFFVDP